MECVRNICRRPPDERRREIGPRQLATTHISRLINQTTFLSFSLMHEDMPALRRPFHKTLFNVSL